MSEAPTFSALCAKQLWRWAKYLQRTSLPKQMLTDFSIWQDIICARGQVPVPGEFCLQHKSKSYRARPKQKALIQLRVPMFCLV